MSDVFLHVCVTCRQPEAGDDARPGRDLLEALKARSLDCHLIAVECLGVCKRPCTIAMQAKGKWTYIYGDLPPDTGADILAEALPLYREAPDGIIPWKIRPQPLKKGMIARLPPLDELS